MASNQSKIFRFSVYSCHTVTSWWNRLCLLGSLTITFRLTVFYFRFVVMELRIIHNYKLLRKSFLFSVKHFGYLHSNTFLINSQQNLAVEIPAILASPAISIRLFGRTISRIFISISGVALLGRPLWRSSLSLVRPCFKSVATDAMQNANAYFSNVFVTFMTFQCQ